MLRFQTPIGCVGLTNPNMEAASGYDTDIVVTN